MRQPVSNWWYQLTDRCGKIMGVTQQQIAVVKSNIATQNRSILSGGRSAPEKSSSIAGPGQTGQYSKPGIRNCIDKNMLMQVKSRPQGKALYKNRWICLFFLNLVGLCNRCANWQTIKLGQQVKVMIDQVQKNTKECTEAVRLFG